MIARRVHEIAADNEKLTEWNLFFDWMFRNYAYQEALRVRKLLDGDERSDSIRTLMMDMSRRAHNVTRDVYRSWYPNASPEAVDRMFRTFSDPEGQHMDRKVMDDNLAAVEKAAERVRDAVNRAVAHRDRKRPLPSLTYGSVDQAIDAVGELFKKLCLFLEGHSYGSLEPVPQFDWEWVFYEPWAHTPPTDEPAAVSE